MIEDYASRARRCARLKLNPAQCEALAQVLQHFYQDELHNFADSASDDRENHIFLALDVLKTALDKEIDNREALR